MKGKYIIALILTVIVATYIGIVLSDRDTQETYNNLNTSINNTIKANTVSNNVTNETVVNNVISNEIVNEIENTLETSTENIITDGEEKPYEEIESENEKIEKAVNIVKEHWGEDSSVIIQYDGWKNEGKYVVVVRDAQTRNTKFEFYVDIETGKYEII